jgi:HJR/Mrr/RecB family endonuclease
VQNLELDHKSSAREALNEFLDELVQRYTPFEGGYLARSSLIVMDNRHLNDNDILYDENYEGVSTLRYRIRELSRLIDSGDEHYLPRCLEDLFDEAERFDLPLGHEQEQIMGQVDVLLSESAETIYLPKKESLIILPEIISTFSPAIMKFLAENPKLLYQISDRDFEQLIAEIFALKGFEVELTAQTRDGGKDIIAFYRDQLGFRMKYIVECKRYAWHNPVDISIVQRLEGVRHSLDAHKGILATTSRFTQPAIDWAKIERNVWNLELKAHNDIVDWLKSSS